MKKHFNLILLIVWMAVIFILSSFGGAKSTSQSDIFVNIVSQVSNIDKSITLKYVIRKIAHFSEYFILGIVTYNLLKRSKKKHMVILSILLCVMYACLDEFHQFFVPGRTCQILDVFIDFVGSLAGIFAFRLFERHKSKNSVKNRLKY